MQGRGHYHIMVAHSTAEKLEEHDTMNEKQLKRMLILEKYNEGLIKRSEAAEKLGISERQITRLAKGLKEEGEAALIHKSKGRKPVNVTSHEIIGDVLKARNEVQNEKSNIRKFKAILEERYGISVAYSTLYRLLNANGIKSPNRHGRKNEELLKKDARILKVKTRDTLFSVALREVMHPYRLVDDEGKLSYKFAEDTIESLEYLYETFLDEQ